MRNILGVQGVILFCTGNHTSLWVRASCTVFVAKLTLGGSQRGHKVSMLQIFKVIPIFAVNAEVTRVDASY